MSQTPKGKTVANVLLSNETFERLRQYAFANKAPRSSVVEDALVAFLEGKDPAGISRPAPRPKK